MPIILDDLKYLLYSGAPDAITLREPNPLDPTTPVGMPMQVIEWGLGPDSSCHDYTGIIPGWDVFAKEQEDLEYYVVRRCSGISSSVSLMHVVRRSHPMDVLFKQPDDQVLKDLIEDHAQSVDDDYAERLDEDGFLKRLDPELDDLVNGSL